MSRAALVACLASIGLALATSVVFGARAVRRGGWPDVKARLASPTLYLFAGYLLVAAFVTPRSANESASPLLGLAVALPVGYAAASFASAGAPRSVVASIALAAVHGTATLAAGVLVLAVASPSFVPPWLR